MAEVRALPEKLIDEVAVDIDGKQFFVRNPDAISALDHMYIQRSMSRFGNLLDKDENTAEETAEVSTRLRRICRIVLTAPEDELAKLNDQQRLRISDFFFERRILQSPQGAKTQGTEQSGEKQTGEKSSQS